MIYAAGFVACASVIFFAGKQLSRYGDMLAKKTGWAGLWIGLMLIATVTSLPELVTGISSSAIIRSADLATGDIFGSCAFNLCILALMDAFVPRHHPLFSQASQSHIISAALGIILLSMAGIALFLPADIVIASWIGLTSILFIIIYLASVRLIFINEKKLRLSNQTSISAPRDQNEMPLRRIAGLYSLFAAIIVMAALALPYFAERIAETAGLNKSFVGTLFLAISTSLPEVAVSVAAIRIGSVDLAVGGLLGSNIFNILILAVDDLFYTKGHLLKDASDINILSVFSAILMSAIAIIGLSFRAKGKRYILAWDAALIFLVYIINIILLSLLSTRYP